jgi:nitrogen fixation negative regulator NifL
MNVVRTSVSQSTAEASIPKDAHFRSLIENASDIITILEPNGLIRYESPSIEHTLGYSPEELVGCNTFEFIHPEDIPQIQEIFREILRQSGTVGCGQFRFRHKDGSWRVFEATGKNLIDDPAVRGIIVNSRDITDRKRVNEALHLSEERHRNLFSTMQDGFALAEIICDAHGKPCDFRYLEVNPAFEAILGVRQDQALGKTVREVFPEVEDDWIATYADVALTGKPVRFENYLRARDKHFLVTACCPKHGQFAAVFRDITEQKRAEEVLRQSEERFSLTFEHAPIGIVLSAPDGRWLKANRAMCEFVGYTAEELSHVRMQDITHPDDLQASLERMNQLLAGKLRTYQIEKRFFHKHGHAIWVLASVSLVRDTNGQPLLFIVQVQDITDRKRMLEALTLSESKYRLLVDQADAGIVVADETGAIQFANPKACEMCGYAVEEIVRLKTTDTYSPKEVADGISRMKALSPGQTVRFERRLRHKDGSELPVEVDLRKMTNGWFQSLTRDISERKRTDERLRLQSAALEAAANAVVITDRNGSILWTNPAFTQLTGYTAEEALGRNPQVLKSGAHDESFYRQLWETLASGQVWRGEMTNRRKDGSVYSEEMTITPVLNERGEVTHFVAIKQDVTGRQQTERALRESEELFRSLSASSPLGVFLTDTRGLFTYINPCCRQILGCSLIESQNNGWTKVIHPDDRDVAWQHWLDYVQSAKGEYSYEYRIQNPDGTTRFAHVRAAPLRSDDRSLMGFVGSIEDITHRRRSEDELRESKRNLERALQELRAAHNQVVQQERLRALGTMASGIAHDFNNALAAILGFTELLCHRPENLADTKKTLRYLQMMNTAALDAGIVVNRLREFYRQREEGEVFAPVDLNKLIEQAVSLTQPKWKNQAEAKGVTIKVVTELQPVRPVAGSEADLREALTNLIFNAVDAMPHGGTIMVRTRPANSRVVMEVADTGTGMTEDVRQRCLEPFFTTKGDRGTGLGLSMVYGIVQRHQGSVEIETAPGKGTTFRLSLPAAREESPINPRDSATPTIRPLRALLVDDEEIVRQILCEYLVGDGHTVETAANGQEALDMLPKTAFDVVILDRAMPGLNGDQVAIAIKKLKPELPVILLTGFGNMMQAAGETPPGIDLVLGKPVTIAGLRSALAQVVKSP